MPAYIQSHQPYKNQTMRQKGQRGSALTQPKVVVSQQNLTSECLQIHELLEKRTAKLKELKDFDLCYLLSTKWLKDWKEYVGFDLLINPSEEALAKKDKRTGKKHPGKINADIIITPAEARDYYKIPEELAEYQYLNEITSDKKFKDTDFIAITQDIWEALLQYYEGWQIRRPVLITKGSVFYDGNMLRCDVVIADILEQGLEQRLKKVNKRNYCSVFPSLKMLLPSIWTIEQLTLYLSEYCDFVYSNPKVRLWKGFSNLVTNEILEDLVESIKAKTFLLKGRELTNQRFKGIDIDSYIKSTHTLIAQIGHNLKGQEISIHQIKGYCEECVQNKKPLTISCVCDEVIYCTRKCRTNDQAFHYNTCEQAFDSEDDEDFTKLSVDLTPAVGLENIGNSCYMNSVIQSLVSLDHIRCFFSTNQYTKYLNSKQKQKDKYMFLHKFSKTIKSLIQSQDPFEPWPLKGQIDYYLPSFKGDKQHDANDFLVNFLNLFNDFLEKPEGKEYHKVFQPFVGEFHSKVICPHCKTISENTEIFLQISLPIKSKAPVKMYSFAVVESLKSVRKGKAKVLDTWKQMKQQVDAKDSVVCITKDPMGAIIVNEQQDSPELILKSAKGDLLFYKDLVIPEGYFSFVFTLVTIKEIVGNKMKSPYGVPLILSLCDQEKTLGTFWLQIIKAYFSDNKEVVEQAELIEKQYFIQIEKCILQDSKETAIEGQQQKQSERCNKVVELFNKRLKMFTDKIGIEVYIHDYKRVRSLCKFCNKRCSNCELPKIFDKAFDDFFADKYHQIKFQVFLRDYLVIQYKNQEKVSTGEPDIHDCLELFAEPEELDEDNAYYCDKCDSMGLALKELHVKKFPSILVLHLNRFKTVQQRKVKNNDPIQYQQTESFLNKQYRLISVIIHEGSMQAGHYWCIAYRNGEYLSFNDAKVTKAEKVYHRNAYILVYELISQ